MGDAVRQATSTMGQKEAILNIDHKKARASSLLILQAGTELYTKGNVRFESCPIGRVA